MFIASDIEEIIVHLPLTGRERGSCRQHGTLLLPCLLLLLCLLSGCQVFKGDKRVAFLGDSITQGWAYPAANFGIFGNTTQQMLDRDAAVLAGHDYAKVIILGGTNDVLLGIEPEMTVSNLEKIALSVQQSGAEPVLCEIHRSFTASRWMTPRITPAM